MRLRTFGAGLFAPFAVNPLPRGELVCSIRICRGRPDDFRYPLRS